MKLKFGPNYHSIQRSITVGELQYFHCNWDITAIQSLRMMVAYLGVLFHNR